MNPASPWWTPRLHADRRPLLLTRNRIQAAIRGWFGTTLDEMTRFDLAPLDPEPSPEGATP